ncbi:hypothetical protein IV203_031066 [Nitzschia inconspicua]|uniref:Uncharacterized protein n=1 Tax=Nitzschia inconspicua TaxID=303405 RepID=A0A9K3Q2A6_9STRA|nr:hypothetical protein IV203_031066 [Nitzschia inconspicua]
MNEQLLVDGTIKLMEWVMMPLEHTPSPGSPQDIWDCCDSDGLLDPVKYNVFCRERAKYEGLEHEMFLDAMMSLLLSQCMAANEEKKETNNKVPRKRRKKGIVHYIDRVTKVMKAGIAQREANMQYQRNVVSVRQDMMITQSRYNAAMGQNCYWRGQLNSDQLQHPEQHKSNHAVSMYLKTLDEMNKRQEKLDRLEAILDAGYSVDPMYQSIVHDAIAKSSTLQNRMDGSLATTSQVPVSHVSVAKPVATTMEENDEDDELDIGFNNRSVDTPPQSEQDSA